MIEIRIASDYAALQRAAIALVAAADQLQRALSAQAFHITQPASAANDNAKFEALPRSMPDDPMTLSEVKHELRLTERQIVTLRRLWGFPVPSNGPGHLIFSRREVERWAMRQPNQENLAAVLRLRRRDRWI